MSLKVSLYWILSLGELLDSKRCSAKALTEHLEQELHPGPHKVHQTAIDEVRLPLKGQLELEGVPLRMDQLQLFAHVLPQHHDE